MAKLIKTQFKIKTDLDPAIVGLVAIFSAGKGEVAPDFGTGC